MSEIAMTGTRDDQSVTFSLKELQDLEQERLDGEARAREEAEKTRLTAERRAAEEQAAEERAEAEQRALAKRREETEIAEREAMQKAIVEQGRLEVEIRARTEERERERRHEIELAKLRSKPPSEPRRAILFGAASGGAIIAIVVCAATYFGIAKPAADRRAAELDRALGAADERGDTLARRGEEQRKLIADLKTELDAAKAAPRPAAPTVVPRRPPEVPTPPKKKSDPRNDPRCADEHDPMCFSLPR